MRPVVSIYTDGGCKAGAKGSYAAYLHHGTDDLMICATEDDTTNNRMELQGVIAALQRLQVPCTVQLYSDSQYVVKGLNEWLNGWKRRNWTTSTGKPVLNREYWQELDRLKGIHQVEAFWVRGHNGHPVNELCDQLLNCVHQYPWS